MRQLYNVYLWRVVDVTDYEAYSGEGPEPVASYQLQLVRSFGPVLSWDIRGEFLMTWNATGPTATLIPGDVEQITTELAGEAPDEDRDQSQH